MTWRAVAVWCCILILAILNGVLRESVLVPALGTKAALVASGLLLVVLVLAISYWTLPWIGPAAGPGLAALGIGWLGLTLAFEFGFGRFVQGKPWSELLSAYTFEGGNLWPLVLATIVLAPWAAARIRGLR